jgi:hypothetical protein
MMAGQIRATSACAWLIWMPDVPVLGLAQDAVCLLAVPVHKTGTAFTKPVDPLLGQAIEAWQRLRPSQPKTLDRKTTEEVDVLFCVRGQPVARSYLNRTIIPALCHKAGVPSTDVRGRITSHRARSTIASQFYNESAWEFRRLGRLELHR